MVRTHSDRTLVLNRGRNRALAALTLWAAALSGPAQAQTVFACEPEWAALSRVLLPEAKLHVATHAGQDPHHIEARPTWWCAPALGWSRAGCLCCNKERATPRPKRCFGPLTMWS